MSVMFDLWRVLRFASRLPLPELPRERSDPVVSANGFARVFGFVGAVIGCLGAGLLALFVALGTTPLVAAAICVAALVFLTGALHEDGLADYADGLGGGRTREDKLRIMRDPAVGAYGVLALVLSSGLRVFVIASLVAVDVALACALLVLTQSVSRGWSMLIAAWLPPARDDGASARLGKPNMGAACIGLAASAVVGFVAVLAAAIGAGGLLVAGCSFLAGGLAAWLIGRQANRMLGGQTGDVLGAGQQVSDLAALLAAAISTPMII
ncbi:MAG: adenosylcobinamide-GDP ribazoletransferase [Pseudomonadota bacterium]